MGGGIFSGAVTAHAGLLMAEGSVVVVEVTHSGIYEAVDIGGRFLAMSHELPSAATVQMITFMVMKRAASVLGSDQRASHSWVIHVEVSSSQGEDTIQGVGSGGP